MAVNDKKTRRMVVLGLILLLGLLAFFIIKPLILSIIGGLILAYIFKPIYNMIYLKIKRRNLSASIVFGIVILIIVIPLWIITPLIMREVFDVFSRTQHLDIPSFVQTIFPGASDEFIKQITIAVNNFLSNITSKILNGLLSFILDLPNLFLQFAVLAFVFYFALRDGDKLGDFMRGLSPFKDDHEKILIKKFKDITDSIVYGQIVVGVVQGIVAGFGLFIFGVPKALILTVVAALFSIIPIAGPALIWIPASVYLLLFSNPWIAIGFILYNILITSTIDNLLRTYIVSRRTELSAVVVLIGMIGGFLIFGILGLILGPLIMAYLITFLEAYKKGGLVDILK